MAYKLYDAAGAEISWHDLQDKGPWCEIGASHKEVFIKKYGKLLNLEMNPEKATDLYAIDLINIKTNRLGDLKTQNTPFFKAGSSYGLDPQFTVTFNVKDVNRYAEKYPDIDIYFWVNWLALKFENRKGTI